LVGHNTHPIHTKSLLINNAKRSLNFDKPTKQKLLGYIRRVQKGCQNEFVAISIDPAAKQHNLAQVTTNN